MKLNILKVKAPFINSKGYKYRPVIQLNKPSDEYGNFQVAFITTKRPEIMLHTDLLIDETKSYFTKTGLLINSYIRFTKIFTINSNEVMSIIGEFPISENKKIDNIIKLLFNIK